MIYRKFGSTGLKISQLGFGAMRLPMIGKDKDATVDRKKAIPMLMRAYEGGVNYFDTAVEYCNQDSQRTIGDFLQLVDRDKIILSTKNHYYGEDKKVWREHLETSLRRLKVDHIDIYNHHGINAKKFTTAVQPFIGDWMQEAKEQGLIRHICCSFHDNNTFLRKLIESGYPDVLTVQYNILDRSLEDSIAYAKEHGIGVVVMGPVGGGRLAAESEVLQHLLPEIKRIPELAFRFVLSNKNVCTALSGMSTIEQVEENIAIASKETTLTADEKSILERHLLNLENMKNTYCTGCGYCMPCKSGVKIPVVFKLYNLGNVYGLWDLAKKRYKNLKERGRGADACTECGECEKKCPQHIPIIKQLKDADRCLTDD